MNCLFLIFPTAIYHHEFIWNISSQSSANNSFKHFLSERIVFFFTFNNITNLLKSHQNAFLDKSNHRKCDKLILTAFSDETKTHQYEFSRGNLSSKIAIALMVIIIICNKKNQQQQLLMKTHLGSS